MHSKTAAISFCVALYFFAIVPLEVQAQDSRPNVVHIFADDLGWGQVGFNNPLTHIDTPNIDALAQGGMILSRSYASTVCSPSRANLLTGFHNGHAANDRNGNIAAGVRAQDVTVGEIMTAAGYHTGIVGKWGWGATGTRDLSGPDPLPTINNASTLPSVQGYAEFFGYLNHSAAHDFYYDYMWESIGLGATTLTTPNDDGPSGAPEYSHDLIGRRSEAFVRDNAEGAPFYLQVSYTIPHFDLDDITAAPALVNLKGDVIFPAGLAQYNDDPSLTGQQRDFSAMISRMDASIGSLVDRLRDPDGDGDMSDSVLANTLIIFSSDNGTTPEDGLGAAGVNDPRISGGLLGGKRDLYEGGIRMPSLAFWEGTIPAGSSSDLLNDLADFQATAADLAGTHARVGTDGVSILPTLLGQQPIKHRDSLLFENFANSQLGFTRADWTIIRGDDKLIRFSNGARELYDVAIDREENNPRDLAANAALVAELESLAFAEGAAQPDAYAVQFRDWIGDDGDSLANNANWEVTGDTSNPGVGIIDETWSALVRNTGTVDSTAMVGLSTPVLGIEVSGENALQKLEVLTGVNLDGRNEIRVGNNGNLQLNRATATSRRWVEILETGTLSGDGNVVSNLYNHGTIAIGFDGIDDMAPSDSLPVSDATIALDFSGIGDEQEKDAIYTPFSATSNQSSVSLDYGPSTGSVLNDRGFNDFDDEFNLSNWEVGGNLNSAIASDHYVSLKVEPFSGLSVELLSVEFEAWRNGANSPQQYAILTNIDGFQAGNELGTLSVSNSGASNTFFFQANGTSELSTSDLLEVRLYGWMSGNSTGHTHLRGAELELRFATVPGMTFNPAGKLDVAGEFLHLDGSQLEIGFSGVDNSDPAELQFDVMDVAGDVTLEGDLILNLLDSYQPVDGDQFTFLTGDSISGTFANVLLNNVDGFEVTVEYSPTSVTAVLSSVTPTLPGDFDQDNDVDCDDIDAYIGNLGMTATGSLAQLDLDTDGEVTENDAITHIATLVQTSNGQTGTFRGDLNCDGTVNVLGDAFILIGSLGNAVSTYSAGDINFDGVVDVLGDAFLLIANLGSTNNP